MTYIPMFGFFNIGTGELVLVTLVLAATAFWIWMLVDCAKRIGAGNTKLIGWMIAIALVNILGAIVYYLFVFIWRPRRPV